MESKKLLPRTNSLGHPSCPTTGLLMCGKTDTGCHQLSFGAFRSTLPPPPPHRHPLTHLPPLTSTRSWSYVLHSMESYLKSLKSLSNMKLILFLYKECIFWQRKFGVCSSWRTSQKLCPIFLKAHTSSTCQKSIRANYARNTAKGMVGCVFNLVHAFASCVLSLLEAVGFEVRGHWLWSHTDQNEVPALMPSLLTLKLWPQFPQL